MLTLLLLAACASKKEDPQASMGITWTADNAPATDAAPQVVSSSTNISIIGSTGNAPNNTTVHLAMPAQTGSYTINSTNTVAADYLEHGSTSTAYLAHNGTITINSLTATRVAGTFSFTAYNYSNGPNNPLVKTIGNGRFDVAR